MLDCRTQAVLPRGTKWKSRHYVDCDTVGIIYLLQCTCVSYYVGKTKRNFKQRIKKHVYAASIGYFKTVIGRHIAFQHNYKFDGFSFLPLERVHIPPRGGDWDNMILKTEARWIFRLGGHTPPGLNESLSFKPFL